jgi:hypothetical protein
MSPVGPLSSSALQILRQTSVQTIATKPAAAGNVLLAAANGAELPGVSDVQARAKAKVSESLFDSRPNSQQVRIDLMRRFGKELGLDLDDYKSLHAFADAARETIADMVTERMKMLPPEERNYFKVRDGIYGELEKKLGLDKLGISIEDIFAAIDDPDGDAAEKLDAILANEARSKDETGDGGDAQGAQPAAATTDEDGLYSP